jgi:cell division protein FtsL
MTTQPASPYRPQYARRKGRAVVTTSLGVAVLVCSLIFLVWSRFQVTSVGYQISRAKDEQKQLLKINKGLKIEGASLKSLSRIEKIAKGRLGLNNPEPQQMVHLQ